MNLDVQMDILRVFLTDEIKITLFMNNIYFK